MEIKTVVCFWKNTVLKKGGRQLKNFMYKAHHSLRFHSIGINILLDDDSLFMTI
jgi:hypothetical protein